MNDNLIIREIRTNDYYKGFMDVINIFTKVSRDIDYNMFEQYLNKVLNQNAIILVAEKDDIIVGTLKILKEYKLHNNLTLMAHIEDVAVKAEYRHIAIGTQLLETALGYTKDCYKTVLSCKDHIMPFYTKNGFIHSGEALTLYNATSSLVIPSK